MGLPQKAEDDAARALVDAVYRSDSRRVLATLIRLLGDFDRAEEAMHDAFVAAVEQWPRQGVPANPRAWLISAGRFKAIDGMRRRARFDATLTELEHHLDGVTNDPTQLNDESIEDDRLRLIFTCCHPALPPDAQIALTLREVCGLTTEEIARSFLTAAPTIAKRIVRAKGKIRDARIPYEVPSETDLPERLDTVLHVIYLLFTEGYSASSGGSLTRAGYLNRSHPSWTVAGGAVAGARGCWLVGLDVAAGVTARRAFVAGRRCGAAGRSGSLALEPGADCRRIRIGEARFIHPGASDPIRCKRPLRRCMPRPPTAPRPTGRKSLACTTCCWRQIHPRWLS